MSANGKNVPDKNEIGKIVEANFKIQKVSGTQF